MPNNGSQEGSLTTFPNQILFRCEEGFILRGSESRKCQANGSWSGNQTFCEGDNKGDLVLSKIVTLDKVKRNVLALSMILFVYLLVWLNF